MAGTNSTIEFYEPCDSTRDFFYFITQAGKVGHSGGRDMLICMNLQLPTSGTAWWLLMIILYALVHWIVRDGSQCLINVVLGPHWLYKMGKILKHVRMGAQVWLCLYVLYGMRAFPFDVTDGLTKMYRSAQVVADDASTMHTTGTRLVNAASDITASCSQFSAVSDLLTADHVYVQEYKTTADLTEDKLHDIQLYAPFYIWCQFGWVTGTFVFATYALVVIKIKAWRPTRGMRTCVRSRSLYCFLVERRRRVMRRVLDPGVIVSIFFIASKVPLAYLGGQACRDIDARVIDVVRDATDVDTTAIATYYATCEGTNPLIGNLTQWQGSLQGAMDRLDAVAGCGGEAAAVTQLDADLADALNFTHTAARGLDCEPVHEAWAEAFYDGVCEGLVGWSLWVIVLEMFALAILASLTTLVVHYRMTHHLDNASHLDQWPGTTPHGIRRLASNDFPSDRTPPVGAGGPAPPPAPPPVLQRPSARFLRLYKAFSFSPECPICLTAFVQSKDIADPTADPTAAPPGLRAVSVCGHSFCVSCVLSLIPNSSSTAPCPVCRKDLGFHDFRLGSEAGSDAGSDAASNASSGRSTPRQRSPTPTEDPPAPDDAEPTAAGDDLASVVVATTAEVVRSSSGTPLADAVIVDDAVDGGELASLPSTWNSGSLDAVGASAADDDASGLEFTSLGTATGHAPPTPSAPADRAPAAPGSPTRSFA